VTGPAPECLVVGYDGSGPARAAVSYAAERVGPGGRLFVVHATGPLATWLGAPEELAVSEDRADHGRALLDELMLEAGSALIDTDYELVLVPGPAAEALVHTARRHQADEIVLGSRGGGRVGTLLGSVARQVLHTADRPVVVIPHLAVREEAVGLP
jgi:nucleotide-binding universal stress UspA family protein